jgi:hypothetical protein
MPAPKGEIRYLVGQLMGLVGELPGLQLNRLAARMTCLCHEILAVERDFSDRAQTLTGQKMELAAEVAALRKQLAGDTCRDRLQAGRCLLAQQVVRSPLVDPLEDAVEPHEPQDHTDDVCPCGDPDCSRPFGHPV